MGPGLRARRRVEGAPAQESSPSEPRALLPRPEAKRPSEGFCTPTPYLPSLPHPHSDLGETERKKNTLGNFRGEGGKKSDL